MEDFKPVRVEPSDLTRCAAVGANGEQCPFQGMPDPTIVPGAGGMSQKDVRFLKYCKMHGSAVAKGVKKEAKRLYNIAKWKGMEHMLDPDVGTNLDEELAVQRMLMQAILNACDSEVQLITYAPSISQMAREIRETMKDNKKLKSQMGELLDRAAMHKLADRLVTVIAKHIAPEKLDEVTMDVAAAVAEAVSNRLDS